jgi:iron(III) transport system ATP-binding protein
VLIRPEGLRLGAEGQMVEVEAFRLLGSTTLAHLALPDGAGGLLHLHARLPPGRQLRRGERIAVVLDPERAFVFPRIET